MNELILLLAADIDIQSGFDYYESCQPGRGEVFLRQLNSAFDQILTFPEIAPTFRPPFRRQLVPGFPYGIFYSVEGSRTVVFGILNLRQDPEAILRRLR